MTNFGRLERVQGDSSDSDGTEWYDPNLGFVKVAVVEQEVGHRADIHFLQQDWHSYRILPNKEMSREGMMNLVASEPEVLRMISAAVKARKKTETMEAMSAAELLAQIQKAQLEIAPVYQ